jgi:hypothetical protein
MTETTLNYSESGQTFWSFLTHTPEWFIKTNGDLYTFDSEGKMYLYGGRDPIDESSVEHIVNTSYQSTKAFDNVEYSGDFGNVNFNKIEFKTNNMVAENLNSSDIDEREDTFKFAIPREESDELYPGRLKGKFLLAKYTYNPIDGSKFTLPYIKTTFRQSNI